MRCRRDLLRLHRTNQPHAVRRVKEASAFFQCAPVDYSATPAAGVFDGVALTADGWAIAPLRLDEVHSSFFERLPRGSATPDSAFLMAGLDTTWKPQPKILASLGP